MSTSQAVISDTVKRFRRHANGIFKTTLQSHLQLEVEKVASNQYLDIVKPMANLFLATFKNINSTIELKKLHTKYQEESVGDQSKLFGKSLLTKTKEVISSNNDDKAIPLLLIKMDETPQNIVVNTSILSQKLQYNCLIDKTSDIIPRAETLFLFDFTEEDKSSILESFKSNPNFALLSDSKSDKTLFFVMKLQPLLIQQKLFAAIEKDDDESLKRILNRESFFAIFTKTQSKFDKTKSKLVAEQLSLDYLIRFLVLLSCDEHAGVIRSSTWRNNCFKKNLLWTLAAEKFLQDDRPYFSDLATTVSIYNQLVANLKALYTLDTKDEPILM
jgi:hypothetical protein